jgi:hypothetical protein
LENQHHIQKKWNKIWGDRLNELVIIGQDLDKEKVRKELEVCLLNENEINHYQLGGNFVDAWPI